MGSSAILYVYMQKDLTNACCRIGFRYAPNQPQMRALYQLHLNGRFWPNAQL